MKIIKKYKIFIESLESEDSPEIQSLIDDTRNKAEENGVKFILQETKTVPYDKMKSRQEEVEKKIDQMFKKNGIQLEPSKWEKYGFSLRGNIDYDFNIQFKYNKDISSEIKSAIKDGLDDYKIELVSVSDGYSDKTQKFYTIEFKK